MTIQQAIDAAILEDPTREDWTTAQWVEFMLPDEAVVLSPTVFSGGAMTGTLGLIDETDPVSLTIAHVLESDGIGAYGTDIFIGSQPDEPDACVTVVDAGGRDPLPRFALDYPNVQVMVRAPVGDYIAGMTKAQAVKDSLHGLRDITSFLRGITMRGDINPLGEDEKNRHLFSLNFQLQTEPADGGNRISRITGGP